MKHFGKLAAFLAAGTIATAGLALGAGSATAATPVTYNCTFTGLNALNAPVPVTLPVPVTTMFPTAPLAAGQTVPSGLVPISATLDLSQAATDPQVSLALGTLVGVTGKLGGSVVFGSTNPVLLGSVPVTGALTSPQVALTSLLSGLTGTGTLNSFTPQGSGLENVSLPAAFTLVPSAVDGSNSPVSLPPIPCTSATGSRVVVGQVRVAASTTQAPGKLSVTGPKKARFGKVVTFKVSQPNGSGTVVAKVGTKVVGRATLTNGAAAVKVKHLKKGKDTIVFSVGSAKVKVKITVR